MNLFRWTTPAVNLNDVYKNTNVRT